MEVRPAVSGAKRTRGCLLAAALCHPSTAAAKAIGMTSLPGRGVVVTGNCRSCEHKNIKHSSKEESLVGQTHLSFLVSLGSFFFQQVSQYALSSEITMLLYMFCTRVFYSTSLLSKAILLVYSHLQARICSELFSFF